MTDGTAARQLPDRFGFRDGTRSAHTTRTMMFPDLRDLLAARPGAVARPEYLRAVLDENVLGKRTMTARRNTAEVLTTLYTLDPEVTVFRLLRHFWDLEGAGRPL